MIEALDNLKDRPSAERKAIALWTTISIVVALFLGWAILFFQRIQSIVPAPQAQQLATTSTTQADASSQLQIIEQPASSTY